ncbi:maleylpyruvate isomerase family mycothiol-dependent enzyme [Saxibacter everestensis]|uniref:Maleylpyruvate isomerase family mycothiol-dependent enzyme n=1 Tax=Saxibacter everestensis TaxID=2909229 RepID=A0ABY8QYN1_9MICO|nr:maleylpyruvate isomerase family mycothiol-dependent enzyme [Brevibacteriaceae bacterium ZFBP1038]
MSAVNLSQVDDAEAAFDAHLASLSDQELREPSLLPGWTRQHVLVHVGFNANAIGRLADWAFTGEETRMYPSESSRDQEIAAGAAWEPARAREFYHHANAELEEKWSRLTDDNWRAQVQTRQGDWVEYRYFAWKRAVELWVHAVDLAAGAGFESVPPDVLTRVLETIAEGWESRGLALELPDEWNDSPAVVRSTADNRIVVTGELADVAGWATGRGIGNVTSPDGKVPPAPKWL